MGRFLLAALALSACGRFGFDARTAPEDAAADTRTADGAPACGLFCDGFEQDALDPRWIVDTMGGTIAIDVTRAYRGTHSLHSHTNAIAAATTNPRAIVYGYEGFPLTGTIYVRVWAYFASPSPTAFFDQLVNLSDDPGQGISMGARNGMVVNNDYTSTTYAESTTVALPLDRWTCLQFEMPSGTTGTSRVQVDGAEVTDIAIGKPTPQPAPTHLYLGLEWVGTVTSQPAADAWFDELRVDTSPNTCAE